MGVGASGQNQGLLFALADSAARQMAAGAAGSVHWSLQRHDPDRDRWLEVGRFPGKDVASMIRAVDLHPGDGDRAIERMREAGATIE